MAAAQLGTVGFWGEPSDVVTSDAEAGAGTLVSPPRDWPNCFKSNATLKGFLGKRLSGKRCRLTAAPTAEDAALTVPLVLSNENSFANALRVQQSIGWEVIKGFAVYELRDAPPGTRFVAHKRWWNAKPTGIWTDSTPFPEACEHLVLLESALAEKQTQPLTAERQAALLARRALGGFAANVAPELCAQLKSPPPGQKQPRPKPPATPPKLEFKGTESLEETVRVLSHGTKAAAAAAAAALAATAALAPAESQRVLAAGAVEPLLLLLREPGAARVSALKALMSISDTNQQVLAAKGLIPVLVQLLGAPAPKEAAAKEAAKEAGKEAAAALLGNLAIENPANQAAIVAAGALAPLGELLLRGSAEAKEQACFCIWNLSCQHAPNQAAIGDAGVLKPLVALLSKGNAALQEEAAGALMNLAAFAPNKAAIAAAGAVEAIVPLLSVGGGLSEQAAGVLMNLASNHVHNQGAIIKAGAVKPLVAMLLDSRNCSRRAREYVAGALMNLSLKQPEMQREIASSGAIPVLVAMLSEGGQVEEAAGALTNLADGHAANQRAIAAAGAVAPLVHLLKGGSAGAREEVAGTLMNLAALDENRPLLSEAGAVEPLAALLRHPSTRLTQEHCAGALANLADKSPALQAAAIKAGALESLITILAAQDDSPPVESAGLKDRSAAAIGGSGGGGGGLRARAATALALLAAHASAADALLGGGVAILVAALRGAVDEAADALATLALVSEAARDAVLVEQGGLKALVEVLASGAAPSQRAAATALARLLVGAPALQGPVAEAGALVPLVLLLSWGSVSARVAAAAALGALVQGHEANRRAAVEVQALPAVLRLVRERAKGGEGCGAAKPQSGAGEPALRCLGALLSGDTILQAVLVEEGGLSALWPLASVEPAAAQVLDGFADCFEAAIAAEKAKPAV